MEEILKVIKEKNINVYSVTEIINGEVNTVKIKDDSACRNCYSVAKAYTMAAIGFLYDQKKLSLSDTMLDIFGELPKNADPLWQYVTIKNLLRHETGLLKGIDLDRTNMRSVTDGDWLDYIFSMPLKGVRGVTECYTDLHYYVLSCVVTKLTGVSLCDYLRVKLFNPMKYREVAWSVCPQGRSLGGTGLYLSTEDMAKLGLLWLNNGEYNGTRLISSEWIELSLAEPFVFTVISKQKGRYCKNGMLGQAMYFSYSENRVLSIQSCVNKGDLEPVMALFCY